MFVLQTEGFNCVLVAMYGAHAVGAYHLTVPSTGAKLKVAAKSASDLAKAKAAPLYATMQPHQS